MAWTLNIATLSTVFMAVQILLLVSSEASIIMRERKNIALAHTLTHKSENNSNKNRARDLEICEKENKRTKSQLHRKKYWKKSANKSQHRISFSHSYSSPQKKVYHKSTLKYIENLHAKILNVRFFSLAVFFFGFDVSWSGIFASIGKVGDDFMVAIALWFEKPS